MPPPPSLHPPLSHEADHGADNLSPPGGDFWFFSNRLPVQERWKLTLSDGEQDSVAMLVTQMNEMVQNGELRTGCVVQLTDFMISSVRGRQVAIVLSLKILTEPPSAGGAGGGDAAQPGAPAHGAAPPPAPNGPGGYTNGNGGGYDNGGGGFTRGGYQPEPRGAAPYQQNRGAYGQQGPPGAGPGPGAAGQGRGQWRQSGEPNSMGGPTIRNNGAQRIVPIDSLTPYTNKWAIKARVTSKSDLRRYQNARGEGKVFSFDLLDSSRGEIRATCFNDAADRFYDAIQVGKVYIISRGQLKPARKQFSTLANDFEIGMEASSQVEEVPDDAGIMDKIYHFKSIEEVERQEKNKCLDVVGVVQSVDAWQTIQTRAGSETQKRAVYLRDDTGRSVELTLWGSLVQTPGAQLEAEVQQGRHPILAAKGVRVGDFNGKNLGTISSTQLDVDPEHPRAHQLRQWYDNGGAREAVQSLGGGGGGSTAPPFALGSIKEAPQILGRAGQPTRVRTRAYISHIRPESFAYPACPLPLDAAPGGQPGRTCNKKCVPLGEDHATGVTKYSCERCNSAEVVPTWRYILSLCVKDNQDQQWLTAFDEAATQILGISANELTAKEGTPEFDDIMQSNCWKPMSFVIQIREDTWQDELKIRLTASRAEALDFVTESNQLIDEIRCILSGQPGKVM